jgi:hypothetical protein
MSYVVTSRWIVPDLEVAKRATDMAHEWYKANGVEGTAAYLITTGEHVGQMQFVVRYADIAAYAKTVPAWQTSKEYAQIMKLAKESQAKLVDQVHYRTL